MSHIVLTDSDVAGSLAMQDAIACMEDAFRQRAAGTLVAPARLTSDLGAGQLVFTVGASTSKKPFVGFRVYDFSQLHSPQRAEMTVVFSAEDGSLNGLVIGPLLGAIRTGAIGGVAVKYLARPHVKKLGVIGTGYQARTQLEAAMTVRKFESIAVFSRTAERREQFAAEMSKKLEREISAVGSAQEAAEDADVLLCATTNSDPVVESGWLKRGVHVNNVGPKFKDAQELGLDVAGRMDRLVTDAPTQMAEYGPRFILHGGPLQGSVQDLAAIIAENGAGRKSAEESTPFYSLGLAGTEVLLANMLFSRS